MRIRSLPAPALLLMSMSAFSQSNVDGSTSLMDKASYPKAYAKWGSSGFKKINALRQPAANFWGSVQSRGDSDCRIREKPVVLTRFYITKDDIKANRLPASDKAGREGISDDSMKDTCLESIKKKSAYSKSFKRYPASERAERSPVVPGIDLRTV